MQNIYKDLRLLEEEQEEQDKDIILDELHSLTHAYSENENEGTIETPWYCMLNTIASDFGYSSQEMMKFAKDHGYIVFKISPIGSFEGGLAIADKNVDLDMVKENVRKSVIDDFENEKDIPEVKITFEKNEDIDVKHGDVDNAPFIVIADDEKFAFDTDHEAKSFMKRNEYSFDKLELIDNTIKESKLDDLKVSSYKYLLDVYDRDDNFIERRLFRSRPEADKFVDSMEDLFDIKISKDEVVELKNNKDFFGTYWKVIRDIKKDESLSKYINKLEERLKSLGFDVVSKLNEQECKDCLSSYKLITKESKQTSDSLNEYIHKLEETFERFKDETGHACSFSVGLQEDGHICSNFEINSKMIVESKRYNFSIDYYNLPIVDPTSDEYRETHRDINLTFDEDEVIEALMDILELDYDDVAKMDLQDAFDNNYDKLKDYFEEKAIKVAEDDYPDYIDAIMNSSLDTKSNKETLKESLEEDIEKYKVKYQNKSKEDLNKLFNKVKKDVDDLTNKINKVDITKAQKLNNKLKELNDELTAINYLYQSKKQTNEDIEKHDTLNPKLFDDEELKPAVAKAIMNIANEFVKELGEDGISFTLKDVILLGSNMSYNYTKDSDLDIHLIADSSALECPKELQDKLYGAYRTIFNRNYDITIKGIPAEVYVEMDEPQAKSNGIYSLNSGWVKKPEQKDIPDLDKEAFDKEFKVWEDRYNDLVNNDNATSEDVDQYINDIYAQRKEGIANEGEYSLGNLLFKECRNKGYLDNLKDLRKELKGKELSLEQLDNSTNDKYNSKVEEKCMNKRYKKSIKESKQSIKDWVASNVKKYSKAMKVLGE